MSMNSSDAPGPSITFDADGKLRVLDAETFKQTQALEAEARAFVQRLETFGEAVGSIVSGIASEASKVENEKLKVIGQRVLIAQEMESRSVQLEEAAGTVSDAQAELARCLAEYTALARLEAQQLAAIEQLTNGEPGAI